MNPITALDPKNFHGALRGLEKENLRINHHAQLSTIAHEQALKKPANDPHYTLDFAEAQLEVITKPHNSIKYLLQELTQHYQYVYTQIQPELLWPASMPPQLQETDIKIARFGNDPQAQDKELYREGLIHRYGKMMQVISGIHYNFSLSPAFFQAYQQRFAPRSDLIELQNEIYFKMIHYFLEHYWLLLYLFGASPIVFKSSLKADTQASKILKPGKNDVYFAPYATSLRQSDLGYHNPKNRELMICFKDLAAYIETLEKALKTPYAPYAHIPKNAQLNAHYLQIENEFYAPIRPKQPLKVGERPLAALRARGVAYLEVRALDINPLLFLGVSEEQLAFIELLLLTGLFQESKVDCGQAYMRFSDNAFNVALRGRDPQLLLLSGAQEISVRTWAKNIMRDLHTTAVFLQQEQYTRALTWAQNLLDFPEFLVSAQMLRHADDYQHFILQLAEKHQTQAFSTAPC